MCCRKNEGSRRMKHRWLRVRNLIFLIIAGAGAFAGYLYLNRGDAKDKADGTQLPGRWNIARYQEEAGADNEEVYKKLIGLGYLQGYAPAEASDGVTVYDTELACDGLNFFVSGHKPAAILMDMQGAVVHTWTYHTADEIWNDVPAEDEGASYWRRAHLFGNGDILAIYEGIGLIKLDEDSRLIWAYRAGRAPHHDIAVLEDGTIYTLTREREKIARLGGHEVFNEFITTLQPDGTLIEDVSLLDCIENSEYRGLLHNDTVRNGGFFGHILHTNTIEVFDGSMESRSPLFKKNNVLVSILILNTIGIIDVAERKLVWALGPGLWTHQHQPTLLKNGNMLVFDNQDAVKKSQVLELDPFTQQIQWEYGGTATAPFFSATCGSNQRLANGNTLITETDNGRAFEVTPDKTIVWEYINHFRAGEQNELIASLFEVVRIDPQQYTFVTASGL